MIEFSSRKCIFMLRMTVSNLVSAVAVLCIKRPVCMLASLILFPVCILFFLLLKTNWKLFCEALKHWVVKPTTSCRGWINVHWYHHSLNTTWPNDTTPDNRPRELHNLKLDINAVLIVVAIAQYITKDPKSVNSTIA